MKTMKLIARLLAAFIMIQTLYFKFTASAESVYIFSAIGMEPLGRIGTGVGELVASVLLLIPSTIWMGAIMGIGLMAGALFFHFTVLGLVVMDDGGQLFIYALIVMLCSLFLVYTERENILKFKSRYISK